MAELMIEFFGEEIPARMQEAAEQRLARAVVDGLREAGLIDADPQTSSWSGPRRLAVSVTGVAAMQPDLSEERRGPRADAPAKAIEGFLNAAGISLEEAETRSTPKGNFLFAVIQRKGRAATEVLPEMIAAILHGFTWPKSMRWGSSSKGWIRPLHRVSAVFDGEPLNGVFDLGGGMEIAFGSSTEGHRILATGEITITGAAEYETSLAAHQVIASRQQRIAMISDQLATLADDEGLRLRDDPGLLAEVAGLVEYPHAVIGRIDDQFMDLPEEILVTSMRSHQKYFAFEDKRGNLAPRFATITNMTPDAGRDATIRAGNERVLRARLADAQFFWDQDRADGLDAMAERLGQITFFENLGTMANKAQRQADLAGHIAPLVEVDAAEASTAGRIAKADLVSQTVGEFPEVQGIIGGYLAAAPKGEAVASAIASHYRPEGPADAIPETALGQVIALADKIDTLVGFFGIGAVPTGSKDPFALRRAALGVIRIAVEGRLILPLNGVFAEAAKRHGFDAAPQALLPFFHDRLKVWLRDRGIRHDIVAAVIRDNDPRCDEPLHLCRLAETLADFLATDDGAGLLAGYTRAANILAAEEKKDGVRHAAPVDQARLSEAPEQALHDAISAIAGHPVKSTDDAIARMQSLGGLRAVIDDFFEAVTVNDDDPAVRLNRLNLLGQIRSAMEEIADFAAIEG